MRTALVLRACTALRRQQRAAAAAPHRALHNDGDDGPHHGPPSSPLPRRHQSVYKSLCKLTLIGRTGIMPQLRANHDGSQTLYLSVATSHSASTAAAAAEPRDGRLHTQWHNVFVSESTPGFSFFHALPVGTHVYVEGLMNVRTVERDGHTRQFVNVNVSHGFGMVRVLSSPRANDAGDDKLPF